MATAAETVILLRRHKAYYAEQKFANRAHYHDHDFVFAKEWEHLQRHRDTLGHPLPLTGYIRSCASLDAAAKLAAWLHT